MSEQQPYTLAEMRAELLRIGQLLMKKNAAYLRREAELEALYADNPLALRMRLSDDHELNRASGAAKTLAQLAVGIAAVIQTELACRRCVRQLRK